MEPAYKRNGCGVIGEESDFLTAGHTGAQQMSKSAPPPIFLHSALYVYMMLFGINMFHITAWGDGSAGKMGRQHRMVLPGIGRYAAAEWYSVCFFTWATGFSFSSNSVACT